MERGRGTRRVLAVASVPAATIALAVPGATAGYEDGIPNLQVTMIGDKGPVDKGSAATYTATVTNQGDGTSNPGDSVLQLSSYRAGGERPVPNPYRSASASQGSCVERNFASKFGTYLAQDCSLGPIAPGASATVTSVVEVNESMDHNAFIGHHPGGQAFVTTLVKAVTEITGDKGIKLNGIPAECTTENFKVTASVQKQAKKLSIQLREYFDGGDSFDQYAIAGAKDSKKVSATVSASKFEPGSHQLRPKAKFDNGDKLKSEVTFHRC